MVLKVTNSKESFGVNVCVMTLEEFTRKEVHPYIATEKWSHIEVDLCDETPAGFLNQMTCRCPIVPIFVSNVTPKVLMRLCEMYPGERAYLRMHYNQSKEQFMEFVKELDEKYCWGALRIRG